MLVNKRALPGWWGAALLVTIAAVALAGLPAGCGGTSAAQSGPFNPMKGLGPAIQSDLGMPDGGVVVDGGLITYKSSDLRGILPPVKPEVVRRGNPDLKRVALTIDDGWNTDPRILGLLKKSKVGFTAFLIGDRGVAKDNPEFVGAIVDAGGEVCSHTWSHYIMRGKPEDFVMREIWDSQVVITQVTHEVLPYIRFSGGDYDKPALDWTGREGYWVVNWTLDTGDSTANPTVDGEVNAVLNGLCNGAIILCHWGGHNTYEVLARLIPEIERRGYEVTTLSRVFEGTPYVLKGTASGEVKKSGKD